MSRVLGYTDTPLLFLHEIETSAQYSSAISINNPVASTMQLFRATSKNSGVDLRFAKEVIIPPMGDDGLPTLVGLGVRARFSAGYATFCVGADNSMKWEAFTIMPRSSICKTPLSLANSVGLIDADYTGELKVALRNHSKLPYIIAAGTSLFQAVAPSLAPIRTISVTDQEDIDLVFEKTARGAGGFGSTGATGSGATELSEAVLEYDKFPRMMRLLRKMVIKVPTTEN